MKRGHIFYFLVLIVCINNNSKAQSNLKFKFNNPDATITLPDILNEISGMTLIDENTLACIQDEKGIIYSYDIINRTIENSYQFSKEGDYEGITMANGFLYVLRSDGVIFEIPDIHSKNKNEISYTLNIPSVNFEGLCFDKINNRLLIASKGKPQDLNKKDSKDFRYIYCFNLETKTLCSESYYKINLTEIERYIEKNNIAFNYKKKKKDGKNEEKKPKIRASEIAVHPITGNIYILSAVEHVVYRFKSTGEFFDLYMLDKNIHPKPEGIAFSASGDMFMSNESENNQAPTLTMFETNE